MKKIGLVLEGGGFRGLFIEGVTSWLIDHNIELPYVVGVSMGALSGAAYISKQKGRNLKIAENFIDDMRYISMKKLVTQGSLLEMDLVFDEFTYSKYKFDFETYHASDQELIVGAMNCIDGTTTYIRKSEADESKIIDAMKASTSVPFITSFVHLNESPHLDGSISDPIPVKKALLDGCHKVIIVTTREEGFVRNPSRTIPVSKLFYRSYPKISQALKMRHHVYMETQAHIRELESLGKALVIRPDRPLNISITERNFRKAKAVYDKGYEIAEKYSKSIHEFINS